MTEHEVIQQLQEALDHSLSGSNSLVSNLREVIALRYPDYWMSIYNQWACWKAQREAWEMAKKALAEYHGEVLGAFKV
jgi:NDP-sugar pyrophosphorylase family protein